MPYYSFPSFKTVHTYSDLIDANVAFLWGSLLQSPYHHGPIDEETHLLLPSLIELNRLGFITVNGQPARDDVTQTHVWCADRQLPFLEGYLPKVYLPLFRTFMESYRASVVYHVYDVVEPKAPFCCLFRVRPRVQLDYVEGTAPDELCVTWEKAHPQRERLDAIAWRPSTWIHRDHAEYDFYSYPQIDPLLVDHAVKVTLVSTDPSEDLEQLMLTFLTV